MMSDLLLAFFGGLIELNLAAAAAVGLILLVRKPALKIIGARATYMLWALVPAAMLATFVPSRAVEVAAAPYDRIVVTAVVYQPGIDWAMIGMGLVWTVWIAGVVLLGWHFVQRQRGFNREEDKGVAGPAVVGFCYPRVVTPKDFTARFSLDERKLILTHEQIHIERGDSRINAIAALVRCLCWFNPLVHWGAAAMSADQELSCDAAVVERRPRTRRIYAETLIKVQTAEAPLPVGCHWPGHPIKERISALARKPVSAGRTLAASIAAAALAAGGGVAAWAAQPERTIVKEAIDLFIPLYPIVNVPVPVRNDTEPAPQPSEH